MMGRSDSLMPGHGTLGTRQDGARGALPAPEPWVLGARTPGFSPQLREGSGA